MATQIFDSKQAVLLPHHPQADVQAEQSEREFSGGAFRGFLFAMLFNVFLLIACAAVWKIWHLMR